MGHGRSIEEGFVRYRVIPQRLAFLYYHMTWLALCRAP